MSHFPDPQTLAALGGANAPSAQPPDFHFDRISIRSRGRGVRYDLHVFSGGEVNVCLRDDTYGSAEILANMRTSDDVMTLLLLTDALRRNGCKEISLLMPYLPYARQDRVMKAGESLALRVMCDLINAQKYDRVQVWDVHSDTALALLDRATSRALPSLVGSICYHQSFVLVAPDAGALKKVAALAKAVKMPFVRADKSRNAETGEITGTVVYGEHIGDRDFLIVDDICDGGRTFIELAQQLRPLTNGQVMLYVTHGIFSRGTAVFDGLIDKVFVANSFVSAKDLPANFKLI